MLCKWIVWISSMKKAGATGREKSFHLIDRFGDHAMGRAGQKQLAGVSELPFARGDT
jgi:hypothetical protein